MSKRRQTSAGETMRVSFRASVKFERMLRVLRETFNTSDRQDALTVPYIVMCAAALEAILNDALLEHAADKWGHDQNDYGNALITMTFRSKLDSLPHLLTSHKYRFNKEHWVYQRLSALITARNNLIHPKPVDHTFPITRSSEMPFGQVMPAEYYEMVGDLSMGTGGKFTPLEYHEAIEKLDKWFLRRLPDRISKVAMLQSNTKG